MLNKIEKSIFWKTRVFLRTNPCGLRNKQCIKQRLLKAVFLSGNIFPELNKIPLSHTTLALYNFAKFRAKHFARSSIKNSTMSSSSLFLRNSCPFSTGAAEFIFSGVANSRFPRARYITKKRGRQLTSSHLNLKVSAASGRTACTHKLVDLSP